MDPETQSETQLRLVLGLLLGWVCINPTIAAPQHSARLLTISGTVVDSDGRPQAGAKVSLAPVMDDNEIDVRWRGEGISAEPMATVETATDGRYALEVAPGRWWQLIVTAPGSTTVTHRLEPLFEDREMPTVKLGPARTVSLQRGVGIAGQLVTEGKQPVAGAEVWIDRPGDQNFKAFSRRDAASRTISDSAGRFEFADHAAGSYQVRARSEGFLVAESGRLEAPLDEPLVLVMRRGATLVGRVVDRQGHAVAGAEVSSHQLPAWYHPVRATSDETGHFELVGLGVAEHQLAFEAPGFRTQELKIQILPNTDIEPLEVVLVHGVTVSGQVKRPDGRPFSGASVYIKPIHPDTWKALFGRCNSIGEFEIDGVPIGPAVVIARLDSAESRQEIEVGHGLDMLSLTLPYVVEESGSNTQALPTRQKELEIQPQAPEGVDLRGRVLRGGVGVGNAWVHVSSDDGRSTSSHTTAEGTFVLEGVGEGTQFLSVQAFAGHRYRRQIEVHEGTEVVVELPTGEVSGRVRDAQSGKSLASVRVELIALDNPGTRDESWRLKAPRVTKSDSRGVFVIRAVDSGLYLLSVKHGDSGWSMTELEIGAAPLRGVDVALSPAAGLAMRVSQNFGSMEPWVRVALSDQAGRLLLQTNERVDADGKAHLASAPSGDWQLWARSSNSAWARLSVRVPGEEVPVALTEGARVSFKVPELGGDLWGLVADFRDAEGRTLPAMWGKRKAVKSFGETGYEDNLWPGQWTLEVNHPDGRSWHATFTARAGEVTRLELR